MTIVPLRASNWKPLPLWPLSSELTTQSPVCGGTVTSMINWSVRPPRTSFCRRNVSRAAASPLT